MPMRLPVTISRRCEQMTALGESDVPLASNSEHHVTISCDGVHAPMKVRVRHVEKSTAAGRPTYFIGLEFVTVGPALRAQIDLWLGAGASPAGA